MIIEKKFKRGIAMIELIFAIVIIGIVLLSSPMLIQQSINSSFVAMQQEAIAAAASQTATLLSKSWDEKDASNVASASPIMSLLNAQASPLKSNSFDGLIISDNSRIASIPGKDTNASDINTVDFNESIANDNLDDIDDYNNISMGISVFNGEGTTASSGDYVDVNLTITNRITFADDTPNEKSNWNSVTAGGSIDIGDTIFKKQSLGTNVTGTIESHIKFVKVNLKSDNPTNTAELVKDITLNAFSCNIGTYPMGDKTFD